MTLKLPNPPARYDPVHEARRSAAIERADDNNAKLFRNLRLQPGCFIILRAPDGSEWQLSVDNSGALTTTAL